MSDYILAACLRTFTVLAACVETIAARARAEHDDAGQTTAEYALILIGAAAVAGLLLAWATKTHAISRLLDNAIDTILPG